MTTDKSACFKALDRVIELIEDMKTILNDGEPGAPLEFLETSHDAIRFLNEAVAMTLTPQLESPPKTDENEIILQIHCVSGKWSGRLIAGGKEFNSISGYDSPEATADAVRDNGVVPDRIEIIDGEN